MRRLTASLVVLLCWSGWTGCSQPAAGAEPREALERYFAAARAGDWEALYRVVGSEFRARRTAAEFSDWARSATPDFARAITARTTHEVVAVHVEGETARIEVSLQTPDLQAIPGVQDRLPSEAEVLAAPLVPARQTFHLLREEGEWRIILAPPSQPDPSVIERVERATEAEIPEAAPSAPDSGR